MKLLTHLLRWDVRRFCLLLSVWLALVAANAATEGLWPGLAINRGARELAGIVANLLSLAEVLLSFVLVAQVVHAHPLVGTTAFWITRPIPAGSLLKAKLVLLSAVMVTAPVVADVIVMAAYRVPPGQIAGVAIQTALFRALWITLIMAAAALTPNLAKFALLVGGALLAISLTLAIVLSINIYRLDDTPPFAQRNNGYNPTSDLVSIVLTITAAVALLVLQYRTRSRISSCAAGLAGLAVALFTAAAWPWPVLSPVATIPAWAADPSMLDLSAGADTVRLEDVPNFRNRRVDWKVARARVQMRGVEPGWTGDAGMREATVRVNDQPVLISRLAAQSGSLRIGGQNPPQVHEVTRQLLGVQRLIDGSAQRTDDSTVILLARGSEIERLAPTGTYEGRFHVSLVRHEIEAVMPLRRGAEHQNGAYRFLIIDVEAHRGRVSVLTRQSDAASIFDRQVGSIVSFYLRNPTLSEAILGASYELRNEVALMTSVPIGSGFEGAPRAGFRVQAVSVDFPPTYEFEQIPFALDHNWIASSELVLVRATPVGSVERRLAIANFPVGGR